MPNQSRRGLADSLPRRSPAVRYEKRITQTESAFVWDQVGMRGQSHIRRVTPAADRPTSG